MQPRAIDPVNADIEVVGQALIPAAIERHSPQGLQPLPEAIAQGSKALSALGGIGEGPLQGFGQSHGQRQRNTAAAQPPLLAAAMELGLELHTRRHQQGANALGAIELVAAEAEQINAQDQGLKALMAHQLGAIDMQRDSLRPA